MLKPSQASMLRMLSIGDVGSLQAELAGTGGSVAALDDRTASLVLLAAIMARDSALPSYQRTVQGALDAGVSIDEILSVLVILARPIGSTAVITAAPKLAMALGYDVDAGLEDDGP